MPINFGGRLLCGLVCALLAQGWPVVRPQDFGAVGDGVHDDTAAMNASIAHCRSAGGCDIVLDGGVFLTGPLTLPSPHARIYISANGTLRAAPKSIWKAAGWRSPGFLNGDGLLNVTIAGPGTIDGAGAAWWNATHDDLHYRPHLIKLRNATRLTIDGVRLLDAPNHNVMLQDCSAVRVRALRVYAPAGSPNTDGINFAGGTDQMIADSHISNGDDCVSIVCGESTKGPLPGADMGAGAASRLQSKPFPYGGNVVVSNVTCVNGHGVSIGSVRRGVVRNVTVEHVTFWDSKNAARIKTYPNNTGLVSGIVYRNITVHRVHGPNVILIDGKYCPKSQRPYPCPAGAHSVRIEDVSFEGVHGDVVCADDGAVGNFNCSALVPCTSIRLQDISLQCVPNTTSAQFRCSHIAGPAAVNVQPASCLNASEPSSPALWLQPYSKHQT